MNKILIGSFAKAISAILVFLCCVYFAGYSCAEEVRPNKGYNYNLQGLVDEAKKKIDKIDKELAKKDEEKFRAKTEEEAAAYFDKGQILAGEGKIEEAKEMFAKAKETTKDAKFKKRVESALIALNKPIKKITPK